LRSFQGIRDQVPKCNRLPNWEIMRTSKSTMGKILHAFYNAGICSQHDIMYISYNILLCLPCREPDLDHAVGCVGFNSDLLASSTIAHDYFDFARTLDYTSQTTTTTHQIRLRLVGLIDNRWRLLDFVRIHSYTLATTSTTHFAYKASRRRLCLVTRW
jgi:hypothetical protein